MIDLKYTITKFDDVNKLVTVTFDDGGWAEIRLTNPLPKNIEDLENIIKQFSAPIEAIEAQNNPDTDLSYIQDQVGIEKITTRNRLTQDQENKQLEVDPEVEANIRMWEDIQFQKKIGDALVKLGVLTENPATIPVENL